MKFTLITMIVMICLGCHTGSRNIFPSKQAGTAPIGGEAFFKTVMAASWKQRDSLALKEILAGNLPAFLEHFVKVRSHIKDSAGKVWRAVFYVSPDYIGVGNDQDFARVPLTPMAGQRIADSFDCILPTKKMVDLIYEQATLKLTPVPMHVARDSSITMWQHHLIIEGQRQKRTGLIAGIKKDIVTSQKIASPSQPAKVAIYGWHQTNGRPIQPLYTGHANWYTDYSHAVRLVYRKIKVEGKTMDYKDVIAHPFYHKLLTDEDPGLFRYIY